MSKGYNDGQFEEDYQMMLPYNSTLDDAPSDQAWNKGWMCKGTPHPLPLFKAEKKDDDSLPDDR
jgi:hypothetical protein